MKFIVTFLYPLWRSECHYCGEQSPELNDRDLPHWMAAHSANCVEGDDEAEDLRRQFLNENVGRGPFGKNYV